MKDFKNNRRFEGGGRDGGRPSFGGGRDRDRQMFKTTCAKCGKSCEVPFRPSGEKPVYCSDCFVPQGPAHEKRNDRDFAPRREYDAPAKQFPPRDDQRDNHDIKRALSEVGMKLDKLIALMTPQSLKVAEVKKPTDTKELKKTLDKALKPKKETKKKEVKVKKVVKKKK